jgi:uncharacterized membrane protein YoaK (UPF0700 family)
MGVLLKKPFMAPHSPIELQDAETTTPLPVLHRLRRHLQTTPPTPLRREILLTLTTLEAGILDASVYASLGRVFVANMAGNIVLLGIAIADLQIEVDVLPILVSLAAFFIGGLVTGLLERWTRQHELGYSRWFFAMITLVDCSLNFISVSLVFSNVVVSQQITGNMRLIIFAFLAFGQGSQLVLTKRAGLPEFSNAVVTNIYLDLSTDRTLFYVWGEGVRSRNRRVLCLLALVVGALIGGEIVKFKGFGIALVISGVIAFITAVGWVV